MTEVGHRELQLEAVVAGAAAPGNAGRVRPTPRLPPVTTTVLMRLGDWRAVC